MKLLFISTNDHVPWGGSEVLWSKVAVALVASGHNVMASLQRWPEEPKPVAEVRTKGVQIHLRSRDKLVYTRVLRTWNAFRGGYLPEYTNNELEALELFRPDHVVLSLGSHVDGKFVRFARALRDRSISYDVIVQLVHPFLVLSDEEADRLLEAYSGARHVVFVSDQNREIAQMHLGDELARSIVIPNPADLLHLETPLSYPKMDQGYHIAMVGALTPFHKGQDIALEVLARPHWRDRSLWLNLYGEGTGRRVLERNIARLRLHRVKLHGHVPDRSVIWSKNHAALFASRMEGLSLALLEALALGRMVVSTDVGGAREHIVDGHTGFMVPFPSADALDVTLERAWLVRDQWDGMGVNARSKHHVDGNDPVQRIVALVEQRAASDVVAN